VLCWAAIISYINERTDGRVRLDLEVDGDIGSIGDSDSDTSLVVDRRCDAQLRRHGTPGNNATRTKGPNANLLGAATGHVNVPQLERVTAMLAGVDDAMNAGGRGAADLRSLVAILLPHNKVGCGCGWL
jgi:hypothetical protein